MESVQSLISAFLRTHRAQLKRIDFVVGVSRGGLIPAAFIATAIDKPLTSVYIDREDRVYLDRGAWIRGKRVLLVDDIVRTGKTFQKMLALLARQKPSSIRSFTLLSLSTAPIQPTWTTLIKQDRHFPWDR